MKRSLVCWVVTGLLVTACSGGRSEVEPLISVDGDVLAKVAGTGEIRQGFAVFGEDHPDVSASKAGSVPQMEGVLEAGPGLSGEVATPFTGALQLRLNVPKPPTKDAIPVVVHRAANGRVGIEPALWDPAASQMVVWATSFSDRWGAWFDPRNWIEEVVQVGQGIFDFVADFVTGRTDPPRCRNEPPVPAWSSIRTNEVSSLHVCAQSNPADDGAERFELFLKSNRRTAQLVTIPSITKDYLWTENMPDTWRQILTSLAGVDADTNMALLGTHAMSVGFRQPDREVDFDVLAYQTPQIIVANPVLALLGNLPLEGTIGVMAAAAKCHSEASGIDITRFDAIPDDTRPNVEFLEDMVRCAFEVLQHPELAYGIVQEVAGAIGLRNAAGLGKVHTALRSLAPTVVRIAHGLAIGSSFTNLWDGIFDNLADGRITATLAGSVLEPLVRLDGATTIGLSGAGVVRAGMTLAEAEKAAGIRLEINSFEDFDGLCYYATPEGLREDLLFMVHARDHQRPSNPKEGVIARAEASARMASPATTVSGVRIGDTAHRVREVYGARLTVEPHTYEENGEYLTIYGKDADEGFGLRMVISNGQVEGIFGGNRDAVQLVEGCA